MNNPLVASPPTQRGAAFALALVFLGSDALAQQTVTLQPSVPKIVTGANFNQAATNVYVVPIVVTIEGGNDVVNFAATGAPAGSTATVSPSSLTNSGLVNLNVTITGV